ncbi:MAG: hypothetical protein MN733_10570 [Nitrososphaera sp.]|nr:hypothetical protein [Nitrososphaera sp.]
METPELSFQLSQEHEQIVRTYKCITLKRWFVAPTTGYLTVTNKRIVFHSTGKSLTSNSLLISEMPLEDVAGLSIYEGLSFNWLLFLLFTGLAYFTTQLIVALLPRFFISYWVVALLILPFVVTWLFSSNILSDQLKERVFGFLDSLFQGKFKLKRDMRVYLPYTRIPLYFGLAILGWRLAFTTNFGLIPPVISWILLLAVYGYIFMNVVGRRHSFSLQIGSKTMKDTGIFLPGDSFHLLPGRETTTLQGLGASPAADASLVIRELGALLMDMQQLGDLGIEKWKK